MARLYHVRVNPVWHITDHEYDSRMESLRVLPPVPMTFRKTGKADYLDGVYVPEGTVLYIPVRFFLSFKFHPYWRCFRFALLIRGRRSGVRMQKNFALKDGSSYQRVGIHNIHWCRSLWVHMLVSERQWLSLRWRRCLREIWNLFYLMNKTKADVFSVDRWLRILSLI